MVVPNKVKDLPVGVSTAIGSLPAMDTSLAAELVFQMDIPALPSFPQVLPSEGILGQAFGSDSQLIENINKNEEFSLPMALNDFCHRVLITGAQWIKFQWIGPLSMAELLVKREMDPQRRIEAFTAYAQMARRRVGEILNRLRRIAPQVVFFFDEPMYFSPSVHNTELRVQAWKALKAWVSSLMEQEIIVGLHCCSQANLSALLDLPISILSFDTELLIPRIFSDIPGLAPWLEGGGRMALGLVPTKLPSDWDPDELIRQLRVSFQDNFGRAGDSYLERCWLTPACGLGLRSSQETIAVIQQVKKVQEIIHE